MLKILILACVLVWLAGLFLGRRRRVIRNSAHLGQLVIWLVLVFTAAAYLPRVEFFRERLVLRAVALAVWFAASYALSVFLARRMDGPRS